MKEKIFLDIKIGDKILVFDEYSHDCDMHILQVESIEQDKEFATENNPNGLHFYGKDLDEEDWGDDYITHCHEGNFLGFYKGA
jgi:hypothetical protein